MRILISDVHAGCQATLWHTFNELGHEAAVLSFSRHSHLLPSLGIPETAIIPPTGPLARRIRGRFERDGDLLKQPGSWKPRNGKRQPLFDLVVCAFPPQFYRRLVISKVGRSVLCVAAHRLDLHLSDPAARREFYTQVLQDLDRGKFFLCAMNEYDSKYAEYYLDRQIDVLPGLRLDIVREAQSLLGISSDRIPTPLIGPVHSKGTPQLSFQSLQAALKGKVRPHHEPLGIRQLYPQYRYRDLMRHPCLIALPNSVFSISLDEMFAMGLPVLVPGNQLLQESGLMIDVKLWPIYGDRDIVTRLSGDRPLQGDPNSPSDTIEEEWLELASWNFRGGTFRWNTPMQLSHLLDRFSDHETKRTLIAHEMQRAADIRKRWGDFLAGIERQLS